MIFLIDKKIGMTASPIVLFDGVCNLCCGVVKFVIKKDKDGQVKFASLQSDAGQQLLKQYHLPVNSFNSFVLIESGHAYTQSTAALRLCKYLSALWPCMYGFIIVPKFIRDVIYQWIAKKRYKWFGRQDSCMIPTPDTQKLFL